MARYHVSEDGTPRVCTAQSPESCTANGVDGSGAPHGEFSDVTEARRFAEQVLEDSSLNNGLSGMTREREATPGVPRSMDTPAKRSIEADLDDQHYDVLMSKKSISRLSAEQWQMLTYEQEAKVNAALAAFEEAQRKENYSMYEEGALDFNQLAISGDLANLRRYVEKRKAEADKSSSAYVQMSYRSDQAALERLEKVVKPGEEQQYVEEQAAKFSYVASFDDAVHLEREKHKVLKSITEKSKTNSRTR